MAYILHIDTSGDRGSFALSKDGETLAERINTDTRNHAAVINLLIDELLAEAAIQLKDIAAVAVCGGPGSYTGLRIGLSTAKALCYVLDIPLLHHDRLLLLTLNNYYNHLSEYEKFAAILPARDKEYFLGIYNKKLSSVLGPKHVFEAELQQIFDEAGKNIAVTGKLNDGVDANNYGVFNFTNSDIVEIKYWSKYAFNSYVEKKFADLALSEPFYLKQVYTHK
jgi:tRNA threonylcarbamoyladenosine biosynthesis protein TsaB